MTMSNSSVLTPSSNDLAKARWDSSVVSPRPPRCAWRSNPVGSAVADGIPPTAAANTVATTAATLRMNGYVIDAARRAARWQTIKCHWSSDVH